MLVEQLIAVIVMLSAAALISLDSVPARRVLYAFARRRRAARIRRAG